MIERGFFEERMERLVKSEFVLTNSLHVTIICLAYKVPFAVSLLDGENFSFPPKWDDVFEWVGISFEKVKNYEQGLKWWNENVKGKRLPSARKILKTFPKHIFNEH
jgi:hypothetical protein